MLVTTRRTACNYLFRIAGREAAVFVVASRFGRIDYRIDEIKVALVICQYIIGLGIKDVVLTVGIILSIILRPEAKTQELFMDFLLRGQTGFCNKWLRKDCTNFAILVFGKTYHPIRTCVKILIVCLDAFKERSKVIVGITEII